MNPQDITKAYEEQLSNAPDYTNALIERAGAAQENMGTLAANAMTGSQTAGVGNYTYNRVARPAVDSMVSTLQAEAMSQALNRQLAMALQQAQRNHDLARLSFAKKERNNHGGGGNTTPTEPEKRPPVSIRDEIIPPKKPGNPDVTFFNYDYLGGPYGKVPLAVKTPTNETMYETFTQGYPDEATRREAWLNFIKSLGYGG